MAAKKGKKKSKKTKTKSKKKSSHVGSVLALILLLALLVFAIVKVSCNSDGNVSTSDLTTLSIEARRYALAHDLSDRYCFFVNFDIPSGTPRFFVWDFNKNKVVATMRCMHGSGLGSTASRPQFSNAVNSNCSSLGRFEVLRDEHGSRLKRSFRVNGLDSQNTNAYKRGILIHSSRWVDSHKNKKYIPLHAPSCQGCFTVSTRGMRYLDHLVREEPKNMLLWAFSEQK